MVSRRVVLNLFLVVFCEVTSVGLGQTQVGPDTVSMAILPDLIAVALKENPAIKAAERRYQALDQIPRQVSTLPDPVVGYTRWLSSVETRVGPQENVFVVAQRLPFPGKLSLMGKIAGQDAEAARYQLAATRRDVVFKVKSAYYDLYRLDRSLLILDQYRDILRDFAEVAATKYATGQGIQAQVLKAQVEISNITATRLSFEKMREGMVANLNAALNRPAQSQLAAVTRIDTGRVAIDEAQLLARAQKNRQELQASAAMIDKANFARRLARKNYLPDFNIQGTYITIPKVNSMFSDAGKDPYGVMVGLNLPIWLGARHAAVTQADENYASQQFSYDNLSNKVQAEIADVVFQIQTIGRTLDLYEQGLLTQAESSLQSAMTAYKTGSLDFLNLLDAERMILQLRLAYTNETANYYKQVAALERAVGGEL